MQSPHFADRIRAAVARCRRSVTNAHRSGASWMALLQVGLTLAGALGLPVGLDAKDYRPSNARCGPFAKVSVSTAPGLCLGLVAQDVKGMRFPRGLLQVAPDEFWLVDMGGWTPGRGKLWRLSVRDPRQPRFSVLELGLDRPQGLVKDAQGRVYVGTAGAVWRYDPGSADPVASKRRVVDGLPTKGRHPLTHLAYDPSGALIINVGAPSDHCELDEDKPNRIGNPCPTSQGKQPQAALYRAEIRGDVVGPPTLLAEGLRNSMALAFHPATGLLLQGENNIDYKEADQPKEELNAIRAGAHYGWPYCIENQQRARHYRKRSAINCENTESPVRLLPAHAAPLGMVFSGGQGLAGFENHWIIAYHGYRSSGQRIVSIEADSEGLPSGALEELVFDWHKKAGRHPRGAPVGISFDSQGRLWMADDRNKAILVLISERPRNGAASGSQVRPPESLPDDGHAPQFAAQDLADLASGVLWQSIYQRYLQPYCADCHGDVLGPTPELGLHQLLAQGWLDLLHPASGTALNAILGQGEQRLMPPPKGLAPKQRESLRQALLELRLEP